MKNFRVLVIDDKKSVLDSIRDRVDRTFNIGIEEYNIEIICLEVEVVEINNEYQISENTIIELNNICRKPFNLLLLDFGYVKKGINTVDEILKIKELKPDKTIREIVDEVVLNPYNLVTKSKESIKYNININRCFIEHGGPLYVFTYIPNRLEQDYTSADVRRNVTNGIFPKATIKVIDSRKELFNNNQFDNKYDKDYYPFLISVFLSKIIFNELLQSIISKSDFVKDKYRKLKNVLGLQFLVSLILSITTGILIPVIINKIEIDDYTEIIVFTIMLAITVTSLAWIIFNFERLSKKLIK